MRCLPPILLLALTACNSRAATHTTAATRQAPDGSEPAPTATPMRAAGAAPRASAAATTGTPALASTGTARTARQVAPPGIVRALYVNRFAAQRAQRLRGLLAIADTTEINAFVVDVKDEFGLDYHSTDPSLVRNEGTMTKIPDLRALLDTLAAHRILPIARIVVFKDSVAARVNPDHVIRKPDGTPWHDKKGLTWVDPYDHAIWDYNIRVAEEMIANGFGEIQFDYIRFPEPYKSLPPQIFRDAKGVSKAQALHDFLAAACARTHARGIRCTADVFGLVTTVRGPLEVGQQWEQMAPVADVLLPMVYPSHYPRGAFGIPSPNADPYRTITIALDTAHARDDKLGITNPDHVRPWLQAFSLPHLLPRYDSTRLRAEKRAVYDAGYDGWVLWNPGSLYAPFLGALDRETLSHRRSPGTPTTATATRR
jgi:hypothetical protein